MIPRNVVISIVVMLVVVIAMTIYALRMRGRFYQTEPAATTEPVAAPVAGPTEQATLFVAYDDAGLLRAETTRIPLPAGRQERAQELLRALVNLYLQKSSPHSLPAGSEVRDVYLVDPGIAVIDLNAAFAEGHRSGVLVEELTVASLAKTLSTNVPGIAKVKFLVDGKERDTLAGHADLSDFYDLAAVGQLAAQLQ
jgi:spore germination protein GerM